MYRPELSHLGLTEHDFKFGGQSFLNYINCKLIPKKHETWCGVMISHAEPMVKI